MDGNYSIYKRDPDGTQGDMIPDFTRLIIDIIWGKRSKITIEGVSHTGETVLEAGDGVDIFRNGEYFLGGIIDEVDTECTNPGSGVKTWTASGEDDTVLLSRRQILADPMDLTFDQETYDRSEDFSYNRLIHYIYNAAYKGTTRERWIADELTLPSTREKGTEGVSAYRSIQLTKALTEIGKEDDLYPVLTIDPRTGAYTVTIPEARDKTEDIIISPEFGNVTRWSRKDKAPEFNAVWVLSGEFSQGRLYVYAEDEESIATYGRIENIVTRSDIKVWEEESGEEEEEEEEHLTEEDVLNILEAEARTQLIDHGVKRTWAVSIIETRDLAFMDTWQVGDLVTCAIDGEKFATQITSAQVTYEKGAETVEPTIGRIERGLFGQLFDMLSGLDDRITRKENE